jgi:hypothetical protein
MSVDNLRGKDGLIGARAVIGNKLRAQIDAHKNCSRRCEPSPRGASLKDGKRAGSTETGQNFLAKRGGCFLIKLRKVHGQVQRVQSVECVDTLGAPFEMAFEFGGTDRIKFVIKVAMKNGVSAVTAHGRPPHGRGHEAPAEAAAEHGTAWT